MSEVFIFCPYKKSSNKKYNISLKFGPGVMGITFQAYLMSAQDFVNLSGLLVSLILMLCYNSCYIFVLVNKDIWQFMQYTRSFFEVSSFGLCFSVGTIFNANKHGYAISSGYSSKIPCVNFHLIHRPPYGGLWYDVGITPRPLWLPAILLGVKRVLV